ncbi:FecR family protein [Mucilaginibacter galii]|uniref:Iron dicitrate transporter FecR n=1 Tax=Mucilaginibacter galii TaxID=2005073 RepID=A0A917JCB0_9SPHI|nr:FecR family protein [Mucilaginibacter galii]GGI51104.1 iron dicitrate transporter FecR [Mucilaginibacter galii]
MTDQQITELIKKYNAGYASDNEKALIEAWYLQFEQKDIPQLSDDQRQSDLDNIWKNLPVNRAKIKRIGTWYRVAAAAMLLAFLSVGIYLSKYQEIKQGNVINEISRIAKPGGNKAVLILSNGQQIVLTDAENGQVAKQGNATISKTADGKVVYNFRQAADPGVQEQNTIATPAGGTYELTLSDGTKVTLDSHSSLRYPVAFNGADRKVELTGQAYFEVAHNKTKPFKVTSIGQTVEVLGTHFNINAYTNEGTITTTLLEGSVKVSNADKTAMLKPGQRSMLSRISGTAPISVNDADVETTIAWKNGLFRFKRADLQTVMRQFARWYDVEVDYEGEVPDVAITGKVQRASNASQVLTILNKLGIKFRAEGKKITVLQK